MRSKRLVLCLVCLCQPILVKEMSGATSEAEFMRKYGVPPERRHDLSVEFNWLHLQLEGPKTDTRAIEVQYLKLLESHSDPVDVGRIYYHLADMYVQCGMKDPDSAIKYATKSMEYPLEDSWRIRIGHIMGGAMIRKHQGETGEQLAQSRRQIVRPLLEGMKYSMDIGIPEEAIPRGDEIYYFFNDTFTGERADMSPEEREAYRKEIEERERKQKEYYEAIRKKTAERERINPCVEHRTICEGTVVSIYTKKPYATEELRQIATEILHNEHAVGKLVARVETVIQERTEKEAERLKQVVAAMPPVAAPKVTSVPRVPFGQPSPQSRVGGPHSPAPSVESSHKNDTRDHDKGFPWAKLVLVGALALIGVSMRTRIMRSRKARLKP